MTVMTGVFRLGRDAEVRYLNDENRTPVATLSLAYNYGRKGEDGKRPTQWIDAGLWGERANKLAPLLERGRAIFCVLEDVHIETWTKQDGTTGHKLAARVGNIELVSSRPAGSESDDRPAADAPAARSPAPRKPSAETRGFDDDDIPF